jgi:hypothetical protein
MIELTIVLLGSENAKKFHEWHRGGIYSVDDQPRSYLFCIGGIYSDATSRVVICSASNSESHKSQISTTIIAHGTRFLMSRNSDKRYYWFCLSDSYLIRYMMQTR